MKYVYGKRLQNKLRGPLERLGIERDRIAAALEEDLATLAALPDEYHETAEADLRQSLTHRAKRALGHLESTIAQLKAGLERPDKDQSRG